MANITIQMDKSIAGYGTQGDIITLTENAAIDAMIAAGHAHVYAGPATPINVGSSVGRLVIVSATLAPVNPLPALVGIDVIAILTNVLAVPTLPTAVGNSNKYILRNRSASAITPAVTSAQTIDGAVPAALTSLTGVIRLISDGANWVTC